MPASAIEVSFCGAATTASTSPASAALIAVSAKASEARPLAALWCRTRARPASGCVQTQHIDAIDPTNPHRRCAKPHADASSMPQASRVPFEHPGIAHHDRVAGIAHGRIERGFQADLRSDARGVSGGDGDFGFARSCSGRRSVLRIDRIGCGSNGIYCQGISEAWITSGTPWPPTDLMARSTSFSPNLWVVTFSSGKRLEASCAKRELAGLEAVSACALDGDELHRDLFRAGSWGIPSFRPGPRSCRPCA